MSFSSTLWILSLGGPETHCDVQRTNLCKWVHILYWCHSKRDKALFLLLTYSSIEITKEAGPPMHCTVVSHNPFKVTEIISIYVNQSVINWSYLNDSGQKMTQAFWVAFIKLCSHIFSVQRLGILCLLSVFVKPYDELISYQHTRFA